MTIEHAIHYLCNLRDESPSANALSGTWLPGCPPSPTKRQAKKLARAIGNYKVRFGITQPDPLSDNGSNAPFLEWCEFNDRVDAEYERLREIAEGR